MPKVNNSTSSLTNHAMRKQITLACNIKLVVIKFGTEVVTFEVVDSAFSRMLQLDTWILLMN